MRDDGSGDAGLRTGFGNPLKLQAEVVGSLETLVGIFREADFYQALERGRRQRLQCGDRRGLGGKDRGDYTGPGFAVKGFFARGHFVEHRAE